MLRGGICAVLLNHPHMPIRLALWPTPSCDFLVSALEAGFADAQFEVVRLEPEDAVRHLRAGLVEVALVPAASVLRASADYTVYSSAAISVWDYPFARLILPKGLAEAPEALTYHPAQQIIADLAAIVLREHYGFTPKLVADTEPGPEALDLGALLITGPDAANIATPEDVYVMDIAQEWYELANYPLPWGLFCARPDEADDDTLRALRDLARAAEANRGLFLETANTTPVRHAFVKDDLRLRYDDLVTAGLTELSQYLFFDSQSTEPTSIEPYTLQRPHEGDEEGDELTA